MSEYRALSLAECVDGLLKIRKPLVVMHTRPDGDTAGSAAALCEIFKELSLEPKYISPDILPERLGFILREYEAAENADGYEAVSVDVASPSQLGGLVERVRPILAIDHHKVNTPFSDNYTVSEASSVGEVLYGVARELERRGALTITAKIASHLYTAISSDTGCFAYSNATSETYRVASELLTYGFDHSNINQRLFNSKSKALILAEGYVGTKIMTDESGLIAYASISSEEMKRTGTAFENYETAIDVVRALCGTKIAFVVKETPTGDFRVSLRSTGADVASVAARHSGGGHTRAAGCTFKEGTTDEVCRILLGELRALILKE